MNVDDIILNELGNKDIAQQVKEYVSMFDNSLDFFRHKIDNSLSDELKGALEYLQILEQDKIYDTI